MAEETPLEKAIRLAREKTSQAEKSNNPYQNMDYDTYLSQKNSGGVKKKVSTPVSPSGLETFGAPSGTSQNNAFETKPLTLGNIIPSSPTPNISNGGGFMSDIAQNISGEKYSPAEREISDRLKEQQLAWGGNIEEAQKAAQNKPVDRIVQGTEDVGFLNTIKNLPGQFAGEAGRTVINDSGNAVQTLSNAVSSNKKDISKLSTIEKLDIISDQSNPFSGLKNMFSAVKDAFSGDDSEKSNDNLASQFFSKMTGVIAGVKDNTGLGKVVNNSFNNMVSSMSVQQRQKAIDELNNAKSYLDSKTTSINDWQSNNPVDKNIFTSTVKGIGGFLPDIAIAALTEGKSTEITAAKYANMFASRNMPKVIKAYAPKAAVFIEKGLESSLTKVFAVKGALEGGAKNINNPGEGFLKGAVEGIGTGMYMYTLGSIAGKITPLISKGISKSGLTSEYATLFANPISNAAVFAGAKGISTPILEGRLATKEEIYNEIGMGIGMSALSAYPLFKSHKEANQKARELLNTDPVVGLKNVLNTKNEDLLSDFDPFIDVANLQKARDEIKTAILKEPNLKIKQQLAEQGLQLQKKIDTRIALNEILTNRKELIDTFNNTKDLTPEQKSRVTERINNIHDEFIKAESEVKKAELGVKVEDAVATNEVLTEQLVNATTPQEIADIKAQAEKAGKQGIDASQKLNEEAIKTVDINPKPLEKPVVENISFNIGDEITIPNTETNALIKELLPDNKALVAVVEDGIYQEQTIDLPNQTYAETNPEIQGNIEPAGIVGTENSIVPEAESQIAVGEKIVQPEIADSGTASTDVEEVINLDPKPIPPKSPTRTSTQLGREPASFNDAVNQFYLGNNKLSTEDFITHTGFGFFKDANGKKTKLTPEETNEYLNTGKLITGETVKMSDELRKAKFTGKVADRAKGGIDADMILQGYIPEQFSGDQGMDLVTEIANTAANKTKGQILAELENTNSESSLPTATDNFGYSPEEIAEMEALDKAMEKAITDEEVATIESLPATSEYINNSVDTVELSETEIDRLSNLVDKFTNENGEIEWKAFEDYYLDAKNGFDNEYFKNDKPLKTIFEYGSTAAKQQLNQRAESKVSVKENGIQPIIENAEGATGEVGEPTKGTTGTTQIDETVSPTDTSSDGKIQSGTEQSSQQAEDNALQSTTDTSTSEGTAKIEKAQQSVDAKQADVVKLQNDVSKLSEKLAKNLKENQSNLFGENKTQSLFDDKADQQKIFDDKVAELKAAQELLVKAKSDLADLKETEGQVELSLPDSKVEVDGQEVDLAKTSPEEDAKIIVNSFLNPLKLISEAQKLADKLENATTAKFVPKLTDAIAKGLQAWRTSKNAAKQIASSAASSIFGGIARTDKDINIKLGLIGGKNMAVYNMGKVMKGLYAIVDGNTESLERVHVVLDPDFYQKGLGGQANMNKPNVPPNLTYNDLTIEEQQLFDEIRKNLDDIHFKNFALGFISKDVFDKHKGAYVPRMYETFELPAEIQEALDKYQDQVGDKLNLNPFKKRKELDALSDESKNAVLKDPVYLMAKRLMQLDTNSAIMTYINHINRNNKNLIYTGADDKAPYQFVKLEGKAYGALDGKYVAGFVAEDLRGYFFANKALNNIYDVFKGYDRTWARQGVKKGLTVYNPLVQLGNFTSNVVFAQLAGVDFIRWFGNTPKAIKELINKGNDYETLLAAGLIGTDVISNDLAPNTENAKSLLQAKQAKDNASLFRKIKSPFTYMSDKTMQLYSGNDDYAKINAYQIFKEQGYSEKEALKKVYDGFQNYATVGKFWDFIAKLPIFGNPFQKFAADLMRITGNAVAKKPLSTSLYVAGLIMLPQILKQLGISEEEDELKKELREGRPFIPKMDLGIVNVPLVYKTIFGEPNLARYITPFYYFDNGEDGALSSMVSKFNPYKSVTSEGYGKGNEITRPFGQDPVAGTVYNIMMDTDFRGKSIQDPQATRFRGTGITEGEKWENRATNALRTWIPNGALAHDTYLNAKYGSDFYGRSRTMSQTLINFAVKIQDFKESDYKKTAEKQLFSITNDVKSQAETIKNTLQTDARARQSRKTAFKEGKIDATDYQNSLNKLDEQLKKRMAQAEKSYQELQKKRQDFKVKYKSILDD